MNLIRLAHLLTFLFTMAELASRAQSTTFTYQGQPLANQQAEIQSLKAEMRSLRGIKSQLVAIQALLEQRSVKAFESRKTAMNGEGDSPME